MILITIIAAGAGFYAGTKYQAMQQLAGRNGQFGQGAQFRQRFGQNAQAVRGDIVSMDATGLTIKTRDGSTKIVILSGNTVYMKPVAGTKDDLKTGNTVMVFGAQNSDGSVTAQNIQINPQMGKPTGTPTGGAM